MGSCEKTRIRRLLEANKVNLEDLGNVGDFLGGIGVVITLLYLAIQIRRNNQLLKAETAAAQTRSIEGTTEELGNWIGGIVENRDVAEVWFKGLTHFEELDDVDKQRFFYLGSRLLQAYQSIFRRARNAGDDQIWDVCLSYIRMYLRSPGFVDLWGQTRSMYLEEFAKEIDAANPNSES